MTNTLIKTTQRPKSWLVKLFDEIASYSDSPIADLEEIAKKAFKDGLIDERRYTVLQHRIPFPGFDYEFLEEVAKRIFNEGSEVYREDTVTRERVRQLERNIYKRLLEYLPIPQDTEDVLALDIDRLPWMKLYGHRRGGMIRKALKRILQINAGPVTVGDVLEHFNETAKETGILQGPRNYGPKSLEKTYEVFSAVGVELPKVNLAY